MVVLALVSIVSYGKEKPSETFLNESFMSDQKKILQESLHPKKTQLTIGVYDARMVLVDFKGKKISNSSFYITIDSKNNMITSKSGCNNFIVSYISLSKNRRQTSLPGIVNRAYDQKKMILNWNLLLLKKIKN